MKHWDQAKAIAAIEALNLAGNNMVLAHYWLSLWGDEPPTRRQFHPASIKQVLPGIVIQSVAQDMSCRLSGTMVDVACGGEMKGVDPLSFVNGKDREVRRARYEYLVAGAVAVSVVEYESEPGRTKTTQCIQLPFWGADENGAHQFVGHTNWRPSSNVRGPVPYKLGMPKEYRAIPIA